MMWTLMGVLNQLDWSAERADTHLWLWNPMSVEEMTQMEADLRQKQEKAKMKELFEQEMKALNSFIEGIDSLRDNDQEANSQERQKRLQTLTADAEMWSLQHANWREYYEACAYKNNLKINTLGNGSHIDVATITILCLFEFAFCWIRCFWCFWF